MVLDRGHGEERFAVTIGVRATVEWGPPGEPATSPPSSPPPSPPPPQDPPGGPGAEGRAPREAQEGSGGPSPAWFFVALGGAVLFGGAATATGVATLSAHDDFETSPTSGGRDDGLALQGATNGLLAGAAVCGVATLVLAFVVDWSGEESPDVARASGSGLTLGRF